MKKWLIRYTVEAPGQQIKNHEATVAAENMSEGKREFKKQHPSSQYVAVVLCSIQEKGD